MMCVSSSCLCRQHDKHERLVNEDWKVLRPSSRISIRVAPLAPAEAAAASSSAKKGTPRRAKAALLRSLASLVSCHFYKFSATASDISNYCNITLPIYADSTAAAPADAAATPRHKRKRAARAAGLAQRALTEPLLRVTAGSHISSCDALCACDSHCSSISLSTNTLE